MRVKIGKNFYYLPDYRVGIFSKFRLKDLFSIHESLDDIREWITWEYVLSLCRELDPKKNQEGTIIIRPDVPVKPGVSVDDETFYAVAYLSSKFFSILDCPAWNFTSLLDFFQRHLESEDGGPGDWEDDRSYTKFFDRHSGHLIKAIYAGLTLSAREKLVKDLLLSGNYYTELNPCLLSDGVKSVATVANTLLSQGRHETAYGLFQQAVSVYRAPEIQAVISKVFKNLPGGNVIETCRNKDLKKWLRDCDVLYPIYEGDAPYNVLAWLLVGDNGPRCSEEQAYAMARTQRVPCHNLFVEAVVIRTAFPFGSNHAAADFLARTLILERNIVTSEGGNWLLWDSTPLLLRIAYNLSPEVLLFAMQGLENELSSEEHPENHFHNVLYARFLRYILADTDLLWTKSGALNAQKEYFICDLDYLQQHLTPQKTYAEINIQETMLRWFWGWLAAHPENLD